MSSKKSTKNKQPKHSAFEAPVIFETIPDGTTWKRVFGGCYARYNPILDIDMVLSKLKERRPVFVSEADFQLELAWTIKELYPSFKVRLEYCPEFDTQMHIDIFVITDKGCIPIELKYRTKQCSVKIEDEVFCLKNQSAKDLGCYHYLKDLMRIETIRDKRNDFAEGYAIMLTNDSSYFRAPKKTNCNYYEFSIHEEAEKNGRMKWGEKTGEGTKKGGAENDIILEDEYVCLWKDYSRLNAERNNEMKVLVNCVLR